MTLPSHRALLTLLLLPGLLALFALYLVIPWSTASAQQASQEDTCPGADSAPTPTVVEVGAVPIVVASTTDEYFVLYVRHGPDADTALEIPVLVKLGESGTTTLSENVAPLPKERYRVEKYLIADPADVDGDCIDDITELDNLGSMSPVNSAATIELTDGAVAIPDHAAFETVTYEHQSYLKFLLLGMNTDRPSVYFISNRTFRTHQAFLDFALGPNGYQERLMKGTIVYDPELVAPDGTLGTYYIWFFSIWFFSLEDFNLIERSYTLLAANLPLLEDNLALYLPNYILPFVQTDLPLYIESRMNLVFDEDVVPESGWLALNPGEGYGLLRVMEPEERPNPRDVVIYQTLPNELPRVAGIITTALQTPLSHVNLRAVQDGVPNAFIPEALDNTDIDDLIGSYVRYTVTTDGWTLRAATPEEVNAHYAASRPATEQIPERDLTITQITALSDIEFDDWTAFGVKAANVAVLGTLGFPAGTVPDGFAVPFYFYDEFMKHNGFYQDIEEMLADPNFQTDFDTQESELKKLRKAIKKGETPEWIKLALNAMHATWPEGQPLRYRSSTNNEDLPGFNGAGLYDSKTQHPEETEEDGIAKSLKQVFASLWNFRAFTEREFHRVDHLAAAMGVLVHPNYSDELANGVAVSFDPIYGYDGYYYVNTQVGEDLVTNPEEDSVPEEILLDEIIHTVLATSNQAPPGQLLMNDDQLDQLRVHLTVIHDHFAGLYSPAPGAPFAMEIEFKITSDDVLAIKQARPWVFNPPNRPPQFPSNETGARSIPANTAAGSDVGAPVAAVDPNTGDTLTYSLSGIDAAHFDIDTSTGQLRTNTALDHEDEKSYTVTVSVHDGKDVNWNTDMTIDDTISVTISANSPATGAPIISGTAQVGDKLTADTSPISDGNGLDSTVFHYQWLVDGVDIHGETEATYVLAAADVGKTIQVRVSFTDDEGNQETLTSEATEAVTTNPNNTPATGAPTISGTAQVGETLTADVSGITDADGLTNVSYTYQWIANDGTTDTDIENATGATYTLVTADEGKTIKAKVSFTDDANNSETLTSDATATVPTTDEWRADMLVVDYGTGAIGAASAELFSNSGGNAGLQAKWLWYYSPERKLRLAFTDNVPSVNDLTLLVGDVALALQGGDAAFTWEDVDVDWEDGQTLTARIVRDWTSAVVALNSPATGLPTINGTAQVGETLTADVSGVNDEEGLTNVSYNHQWIANDGTTDTDIQDATDSTYTLTDDDAGKTIKVRLSFTDDANNEETLTSAATAAVAAKPNAPATGAPTISGTPQVGETLTADTSGIADTDGLTNVSYSYQWLADDANIDGATGSTYILANSDEGKAIQVRVSFTDDADNQETLTSAATAAVAAKPNSLATGAPTISGTVQVGETLTANTSGIADADGLTSVSYSYQWLADDANIDGATGSTYILANSDEGKAIKVRVSFTDDADNPETLTSAATAAVAAKPNTPATGAPTISGTAQVDETLTADVTGIADGDGLTNVSYTYQWISNDGNTDTDIQDATDSTYTLTDDDAGKTIKVKVSFTDDANNEETLTSAPTAAVAAKPNSPPTGLPSISGTAQVGETLTTDVSGIADADGLDADAFGYQWVSNDGNADTDIQDATDSTYTLTDDDAGKTIMVKVSFTDDANNQESLTSAATAAVVAKPNSPPTGLPVITGEAQVDETLTAVTSGISDADGLTSVSYSYQWIRSDGGTDTDIEGDTTSTYTLSNSDIGKTFRVRVSFTDDAGHGESLIGAPTASVTPASRSVIYEYTPTAHPTSLVAEWKGGSVRLTWYAPRVDKDSISGYSIYRNSEHVVDRLGSGTMYRDGDATDAGSEYTYCVKARREGGNYSECSNEASITIPGATDSASSGPISEEVNRHPTDLTVSLVNGEVLLRWEAPGEDAEAITGYEILRRRPSEGEHTLVAYGQAIGGTTFTDVGANDAGVKYTYRVKALRGEERSRWSNYANITLAE